MEKYDVVIVGSGPNGFAAAITMQQQGLATFIVEGADSVGGGMRTKEFTLPGFKHDVCSAIHPMLLASPFLKKLPLDRFGLKFTHARYAAAHPLDSGEVGLLYHDVEKTALGLGNDAKAYRDLLKPIVDKLDDLLLDTMGPFRFPKQPLRLAEFGLSALLPATWNAQHFKTEVGKALWAGMAGHGLQPLSNWATSAIGLMLMAVGNKYGWPIPIGGSQSIADAMRDYYLSIGGKIKTGTWVKDIRELPPHNVLILDMTPRQLLEMEGISWSNGYKKQLQKYRYGMGVFKVDWALSDPTPFKDGCSQEAATVHLGNTIHEISQGEWNAHQGKKVDKPLVLFVQASQFDKTRAPEGKHTGWAYCHVPHGTADDYTAVIENQVERFAPGFKDTILARHTFSATDMQTYNPNYIGGDINGGIMDIRQLYTRPTLSLTPYRTSAKHIYLCSSSTPPGGGVHGMCGFHAAKVALKDCYDIHVEL